MLKATDGVVTADQVPRRARRKTKPKQRDGPSPEDTRMTETMLAAQAADHPNADMATMHLALLLGRLDNDVLRYMADARLPALPHPSRSPLEAEWERAFAELAVDLHSALDSLK